MEVIKNDMGVVLLTMEMPFIKLSGRKRINVADSFFFCLGQRFSLVFVGGCIRSRITWISSRKASDRTMDPSRSSIARGANVHDT